MNRWGGTWGIWRTVGQIGDPARTVLICDTCVAFGWEPYDYHDLPDNMKNRAAQRHNGGRNYGFCDGHIEWAAPSNALNFIWAVPE